MRQLESTLAAAAHATLPRRTVNALATPGGIPVPLTGLLAHTRPAYGGRTWAGAISTLMTYPDWARIVTDLIEDITDGRPMQEPVRVARRRGQRVLNGMHRIAAHAIAGATSIKATSAQDPTVLEIVELQLRLVPVTDAARAFLQNPDGGLCEALMLLRSLRAGEVWASADGIGTSGGIGSCAYYVPHAHRDELVRAVTARAAELGYAVHLHDVVLTDTRH